MKIKKTCEYCKSELLIDEKEINDFTKKQEKELKNVINYYTKLKDISYKDFKDNKAGDIFISSFPFIHFSYELCKLYTLNKKYFKCPICKEENFL
jgi:hypothetical protein